MGQGRPALSAGWWTIKTGRKSFDLTEVWHGLGLQMLLYLFTLEEEGDRIFGTRPIPAGVLYLPAPGRHDFRQPFHG